MSRKVAYSLISLALVLGFAAGMGLHLKNKKQNEIKLRQIQAVALQHASALQEFRPVFGLDDNGNKQTLFYVKIEQLLPLHQQLRIIGEALSRHYFSYLPIELQGIQEYNNKKIAVINLSEFEGFRHASGSFVPSWAQLYFQGSHGGSQTVATLLESFLQRDNPLPWIDGVVFLYEEQPIGHFEHVAALGQTTYR